MYKSFIKRCFDLVISILIMPFIIIEILILGFLIKAEDKGPVFYLANRIGEKGKIFKMFKLRSMKVNAPDLRNLDGSTYNSDDDPRVTRIGKFIRKYSLDEFPQFINVLLGDMSIIGPRPNLPSDYNQMTGLEKRRLEVKPGITGYNQAYYRNSVSTEEKYKNDVYYVDNISFLLDVKIFFKTISVVIKHENINSN